MGGDSAGIQAPAERSGWPLRRGGGQDVLWDKGDEGQALAWAPDGGYFCLP